MIPRIIIVLILFGCFGCEADPPKALGTLEWDRVNSRAIAGEVITRIGVREGDIVSQGDFLLQLDNRKVVAEINEVRGELEEARWLLKELETGPRPETIAEARARVAAAEAVLESARIIYERRKILLAQKAASQEHLDIAKKEYLDARARLTEQGEGLAELLAGTRKEEVEQARARVRSLESSLHRLELFLDEYRVTVSRDGRVDSLPFKLGDRPQQGAVLSTILAGKRPWARVYIPEPYRSTMQPGQRYQLRIDGQKNTFTASLRTISSEASFTPYFALSEKDRSRLSYVAELDLIDDAADSLTAGTPVQLLLEKR